MNTRIIVSIAIIGLLVCVAALMMIPNPLNSYSATLEVQIQNSSSNDQAYTIYIDQEKVDYVVVDDRSTRVFSYTVNWSKTDESHETIVKVERDNGSSTNKPIQVKSTILTPGGQNRVLFN